MNYRESSCVRHFHVQRALPGRLTGLLGLLGSLSAALAFSLLAGCGGGDDCGQEVGPPSSIAATRSPYQLRSLMSDLSIGSVRWVNATTGESGIGTVAHVHECLFLLGCATWSELVVMVPLIPGVNTVHRYYTSDGCEWRDDYLITLD